MTHQPFNYQQDDWWLIHLTPQQIHPKYIPESLKVLKFKPLSHQNQTSALKFDTLGGSRHLQSWLPLLAKVTLPKLGAHHSWIAMRSSHLAPHHTELASLHLLLSLVDVGHTFTNIELGILLGTDTINLQQGAVGIAIGLASLVTSVVIVTIWAMWPFPWTNFHGWFWW